MQFIDAFNAFHNWAEYNNVSPNAQLLWTKILYLFNKNFWPETLAIPPAMINSQTHFTRAGTLSEARRELIGAGWLEYDKETKEYKLQFPTMPAPKKEKKAKATSLPYEEIKDFWNEHHGDMPKIDKISSHRKQKLRRITKDHSVEDIKAMILKAESSDFLNGRTGNWKADFDFFLRPDKFDKTLEGSYDNKKSGESIIDPDEDLYAEYR